VTDPALTCAFVPVAAWIADRPRVAIPGDAGLFAPRIEGAAVFDLVARLTGACAARRPTTAAVVAALDTLARRLADGAHPLRRRLAADLAAATGATPALVDEELARCAGQLRRESCERLLALELGDPAALDGFVAVPGTTARRCARAPGLLAVFLPGNVFAAGVTALARALLLRCPAVLKPAAGDPATVPALLHELQAIDPSVTAGVAAWWWRGGDPAVEEPLLAAADVVVAHGDDAALAAIHARVHPPARVVAYGPRVSAVLVAREALAAGADALAAAVATDVALYDQAGCLSAAVVAIEGTPAEAEAFGARLAAALADAEARWPAGAEARGRAAAVTAARRTLAMSEGTREWAAPDGAWAVVVAPQPPDVPLPGGRVVVVRPFADLRDVWTSAADEWASQLQAVALAASPARAGALALDAARAGVARICRPGELQSPPLAWPQDGRPALGDLVAWTWWDA
jgi:hypothetical protein